MTKNIFKILAAAALALAAFASPALAQSSPGWTYGYVPTPAQWNAAFASKQDYVGSAFLPLSGGTMTGRLTTSTPNSSGAGFTLPQGADPSAPNNGDLWTTSAGLKARINGITYNLTSGTIPLVVGTTPITGGSSGAPLSNNAGLLANGLIASTWSTFQQVGTGSVSQTVQAKLVRWFDVEDFGAVGNGVADDAPAIRAAMLAASNAGGGNVMLGYNKTYLLATKYTAVGNGNTILPPYSKVYVRGQGISSVLKVANGMNTGGSQFLVFYPPDLSATYTYTDLGFFNFKIDENGLNNLTGPSYQNVAIGCNYCTGVEIQNVTFANNPWSQYIQIGGNGLNASQVNISNNTFLDACDVIAGSTCTDHSSIFVVATGYVVNGNVFRFSAQSTKATAIELHGIDGVAVGNAISNYSKVANIAAEDAHSTTGITFVGNAATSVRYGVGCWARNTQTLTAIQIANNTFQRSAEPVGSGVGFIDCGESGTQITNANSSNIFISDNVISSSAALGTAATDPVIVVGQIKGLYVEGNKIQSSNGPCIGNGANTLATSTRLILRNNVCIDTGGTSTAGSRRGILISSGTTIDTILISGNRIENVGSTYMTTGIDVTLTATYGLVPNDNFVSNVATPTNISGSGYTVVVANSLPYATGIGLPFSNTGALAGAMINTDPSTSVPSMTRTPVLGVAGSAIGSIGFRNLTSGSVVIQPDTGALGTSVATLKAGTYDLVGTNLTQTLTGKSIPSFDGGSAAGSTVTINGTSSGAPVNAYLLLQTNGQRTGIGQSTPNYLLHVGAGTDSATSLTPTFYVSAAGTTSFAVRDSTNDIQFGMFTNASPAITAIGNQTNHDMVIQTNANNMATFHKSGGFSVGPLGTNDPGNANAYIVGALATKAAVTLTGTSGTVGASNSATIFNASGTFTATLPACNSTNNPGRWLYVKSIAAQTVNSASSNVIPRATASAGTALLASGAGNWAVLQCDGSASWVVMAGN